MDPYLTKNPKSMNDSFFSDSYADPHHNSTVISRAAFLMQLNGLSFDTLHQVWYDSLSEGFDKKSDFYTVRTNVIKAARKNNLSFDEISIITDAFDTVGITPTGSVNITVLNNGVKVEQAYVTLTNYSRSKMGIIGSSSNGTVNITGLTAGTSTIKVEIPNYSPIYSQVLIKTNRTVNKTIELTNAMSFSNIWYNDFDHYNSPESYSETLPKHIIFEEQSIKMMG